MKELTHNSIFSLSQHVIHDYSNQVEESELSSERIGLDTQRSILIWEAAEGGAGVLRRLIEERDAVAGIARAALERLHYDLETLQDNQPNLVRACYECMLSYNNQRDHRRLDRHLVRNFLVELMHSTAQPYTQGRTDEQHYRWLCSMTDSQSELERRFVDLLYDTQRRLPDEAQMPLQIMPVSQISSTSPIFVSSAMAQYTMNLPSARQTGGLGATLRCAVTRWS